MLVRNGFDYLTAFEIVFKIHKVRVICKRYCLHSSVNKHFNMHSPTITETVQIVKKVEKRTKNKVNQLKRGFSITVKKTLKL